MEAVFTWLSRSIESAPLLALSAALIWGVLSIVLSPCHLASIPLIVGFISDQGPVTTRRAFGTASLFALGILITIALIGIVTAALGRMIGDLGGWVNYAVAVIFFAVGLHLLDILPLPIPGAGAVSTDRRGYLAAFLLGLIFGIALGPCTFAYMAPVLAATFKAAASAPVYASALLLAYGIGHCAVIVGAGTSTEAVQRFLSADRAVRATLILKRVCGILVLAGGLYLLYTAR